MFVDVVVEKHAENQMVASRAVRLRSLFCLPSIFFLGAGGSCCSSCQPRGSVSNRAVSGTQCAMAGVLLGWHSVSCQRKNLRDTLQPSGVMTSCGSMPWEICYSVIFVAFAHLALFL